MLKQVFIPLHALRNDLIICVEGTKPIQWEFVHGLLVNAVYGGRVDNTFDLRVLASYLRQYFNNETLGSEVEVDGNAKHYTTFDDDHVEVETQAPRRCRGLPNLVSIQGTLKSVLTPQWTTYIFVLRTLSP